MKLEETLTIMTENADINLTLKEIEHLHELFGKWLEKRRKGEILLPIKLASDSVPFLEKRSKKIVLDEQNTQLQNFLSK